MNNEFLSSIKVANLVITYLIPSYTVRGEGWGKVISRGDGTIIVLAIAIYNNYFIRVGENVVQHPSYSVSNLVLDC